VFHYRHFLHFTTWTILDDLYLLIITGFSALLFSHHATSFSSFLSLPNFFSVYERFHVLSLHSNISVLFPIFYASNIWEALQRCLEKSSVNASCRNLAHSCKMLLRLVASLWEDKTWCSSNRELPSSVYTSQKSHVLWALQLHTDPKTLLDVIHFSFVSWNMVLIDGWHLCTWKPSEINGRIFYTSYFFLRFCLHVFSTKEYTRLTLQELVSLVVRKDLVGILSAERVVVRYLWFYSDTRDESEHSVMTVPSPYS
jgi:hypothetical protein